MSITFSIAGQHTDWERSETFLNLANINALELLQWLGYEADYYGHLPARELAARCRRRLWDVARNHDPELPAVHPTPNRPCVTFLGRRAGYLRERTAELLSLAEAAGEGAITFS